MEQNINEIEINGVKYYKKGTEQKQAEELNGMPSQELKNGKKDKF